jgi:hypothetical protein
MRKASRILSPKGLAALSLLTLFSCSVPFFGKGRVSSNEEGAQKLATLSGVLDFKEGCEAGYYKIVLKGLFDGAGVQVETQSDSLGRFSVTAPPGKYIAQVVKEQCGSKEAVELEKNTEHMLTFVVQESKAIEKVGDLENHFPSRLPASVMVPSKTSN